MNGRERFEESRRLVEARLSRCCTGEGLDEAMRYSLLAGGKRIRPVLVLEFCRAAGGNAQAALDAACGVEMLHTYSLIHDDLPCMDNDDLRRGMPTCHKVFGECTATLAGDALQAEAFSMVLSSPELSGEARARMGLYLARAVGAEGMCGGQYLDMSAEGRHVEIDDLKEIHGKKTAALLKAACAMGVLAAGIDGSTESKLAAAEGYAAHLGLAFQIRDDLLDVISTTEELGKPAGSDRANEKQTFVSLLGRERCEALVAEHSEKAKACLEQGGLSETEFLCWLADYLADRTN